MWAAYRTWCDENGESELSRRSFGDRLRQRGLDDNGNKPVRLGQISVKIWRGVLLQADQQQNQPNYEPDGASVTDVTDVTGFGV